MIQNYHTLYVSSAVHNFPLHSRVVNIANARHTTVVSSVENDKCTCNVYMNFFAYFEKITNCLYIVTK